MLEGVQSKGDAAHCLREVHALASSYGTCAEKCFEWTAVLGALGKCAHWQAALGVVVRKACVGGVCALASSLGSCGEKGLQWTAVLGEWEKCVH